MSVTLTKRLTINLLDITFQSEFADIEFKILDKIIPDASKQPYFRSALSSSSLETFRNMPKKLN